MGGSSSKSTQNIKNTTLNKTYMETLNQSIMNAAVNTVVNNASKCSSAVNIINSCDLSGTNIVGDLNVNSNQTAKANVNFSCLQANETQASMASQMLATITAEMKALSGTDAATQLNNAAQSSANMGFLSTPVVGSSAKSSTNQSNDITNDTISTVRNIFEQNLISNFTANTVNECIGLTNINNSTDVSGLNIKGNVNVNCVQTATVEQVQKCEQLANAISKTTMETFQDLGLDTSIENVIDTNTESTTTSTSELVSTGPIEEIGTALSGILDSIGLAFLSAYISPISLCCCVIIILIFVLVVGFKMFGSSTQSGQPGQPGQSEQIGIPIQNTQQYKPEYQHNLDDPYLSELFNSDSANNFSSSIKKMINRYPR